MHRLKEKKEKEEPVKWLNQDSEGEADSVAP